MFIIYHQFVSNKEILILKTFISLNEFICLGNSIEENESTHSNKVMLQNKHTQSLSESDLSRERSWAQA